MRRELPPPKGENYTEQEVSDIMESPLYSKLFEALVCRSVANVHRNCTVSKAIDLAITEENTFEKTIVQGYGQTFKLGKQKTLENVFRRLNAL